MGSDTSKERPTEPVPEGAPAGDTNAEPRPSDRAGVDTPVPSAAWTAPSPPGPKDRSTISKVAGHRLRLPVWALAVAGVVLLVIGGAIGTAASSSDRDRLKDENAALEQQNRELENDVDDREAQRAADEAEQERLEAEQQAAEREAQQREQEELARQQAQAEEERARQQAEAEAAAAAEAEAERRRNTVEIGGVYAIGPDINAGQWRTPGPDLTGLCYYAILNSPDTFDIATNSLVEGPSIAQLPEGKYFETSGCQPWTRSG